MSMRFSERQQRFSQQLTGCQDRLYAYISALVASPDAVDEVLQRANVVILRKADEYDEAAPFVAWACKIAYYEVLGWRRDRSRDRLRFDDAFVATLAEAAAERSVDFDDRRRTLRRCMGKLSEDQRSMLLRRYTPGESVQQIAESVGRPVASVSQALYRIRRVLVECVRRAMSEDPA